MSGFNQRQRFEAFVSKVDFGGECWTWTATKIKGYGRFWNGTKFIPAHHFLLSADIPKGKEACHKCDNRACVRPSHIFIGTRSDNMRDCVSKGRHNTVAARASCLAMLRVRRTASGETQGCHKLTADQVKEILGTPIRHGVQAEMARRYGVTRSTINGIVKGKGWIAVRKKCLS